MKTSYVIVQRKRNGTMQRRSFIKKHLMLLFNRQKRRSGAYGSGYLKTSYVIIQLSWKSTSLPYTNLFGKHYLLYEAEKFYKFHLSQILHLFL